MLSNLTNTVWVTADLHVSAVRFETVEQFTVTTLFHQHSVRM